MHSACRMALTKGKAILDETVAVTRSSKTLNNVWEMESKLKDGGSVTVLVSVSLGVNLRT